MNTNESQLVEFARKIHLASVVAGPAHGGLFKGLFTIKFGERAIPILLAGNALAEAEDGHCIAILNPSRKIIEKISPGVAYGPAIKAIVSGECEIMLDMYFEHYKKDDVIINYRYLAAAERGQEVEIT